MYSLMAHDRSYYLQNKQRDVDDYAEKCYLLYKKHGEPKYLIKCVIHLAEIF